MRSTGNAIELVTVFMKLSLDGLMQVLRSVIVDLVRHMAVMMICTSKTNKAINKLAVREQDACTNLICPGGSATSNGLKVAELDGCPR